MDFRDQVKSSVDIVSVIGEYVRLRRSGTQRYMGLCPFHNEKKPSFTVHVTLQIYKCFSCGVSGDVIKFVQEKEGLTFWDALKSLAERHGIPIPKRTLYADEDSKIRGALIAMHEAAQENFRANLNSQAGEMARAYIAKRGLAPETIEHFGLGYSDRSGRALLRLFEQREFSVAQMEQSGLVLKSQRDGSLYDRFRNRLMFPIHNEMGKIIAFGGRALSPEDEPKYLNSPETTIYKKSAVLYNLHRAKDPMRKDDRVILVEGYMDAIGVTAAGVGNVVASCGTALTETQVRSLKRHTHRIAVNFDPDAAGESAAERSLKMLLTEGMQVRVVELEDELDPDEYCKEHGSDAYRNRVEHAKGYFYWLADRARTKFDMRTADGKVDALSFLLSKVQLINDHLERMTIANELAGYVGIEKGAVIDEFRRLANERREPAMAAPKITLRPDERMLLIALLTESGWRADIVARLKHLQAIESLESRRIFNAVFALEEGGGNFGYDELNARLEPPDQELLAHALLNEDFEITQEEVAASLESMRRTEEQFRGMRLKTRVKELEREGKFEEALALMAQLPRARR
ncbi:MAG TPA: DNA primase [Candidatus Solibacter sp.]|nr:DNA primase [Candidatus Solibacter sp.]